MGKSTGRGRPDGDPGAARMAALISAAFIAAWAGRGLSAHRAGLRPALRRVLSSAARPAVGVAFMGMKPPVWWRPCHPSGAAEPHRLDQRPEPHQQHRAESVVDPDVGSNRRRRRVHVLLRVRRDALLRWTAGMGAAAFPGSVVPRVSDATAAWAGFAALIRSRQSTAAL